MRKVKSVKIESKNDERIVVVCTLTDKSSSPFSFVKDDGEWVLQGDDRQRFCKSELKAMVNVMGKFSKGKTSKKKVTTKSKTNKSRRKKR
jgi:hypothetical protein